jgi:Zn-dependent metalloprotease
LTHGVVSNSADLIYQGESGALNEHFADVFGTLIKQQKAGQTVDKADWLIGREVITPAPTRKAIRSMAAPGTAYVNDPLLGTDPQPGLLKNQYAGAQDNGGVHINSGIPNHAFYLAAMALKGKAWLTVGPVWFEVLTTRLVRTSQFADMARETIDVAGKSGAAVRKALKAAWKAVGL